MNSRFLISTLFMTVVTAMLLTACERHGAVTDLQEYVQKIKRDEAKKKRVSLIEELKPPIPATFKADNKRSPFSLTEIPADRTVAANPLLGYPLNVLKFVGTLSQGDKTFAFIMTPDNMVYQVKEGDMIGDHHGKVVDIKPNRLNVMEQETENGTAMQRIVTLELKEGM